MKRALKLIAVFLVVGIAFVACKKDSTIDQQNVQNVQSVQQTFHELGMNFLPEEEYSKIPNATTPILLKALPTSVALNTAPVGDQGGEGSCVAWGTTYAGRSAQWVKDHTGTWSQSTNIFSPEYVYNQIKASSSCASGAYVTDGLNLLKSQGSCTWKSMPYTDVSCSTKPNTTQKAEAANYKITSYAKVAITTTAIKTQLAAGNPVVVGGSVNMAFERLASGAVLGAFKKPSLGGHCYCVVGYDDAKNAFKFQNSWGTSWASAGFGWINYNNISGWWSEAYVMTN
jgi:C1A family cysteine protease